MGMSIPRFRITLDGEIHYRAHTIAQIIEWLENEGDMSLNQYWVECIQDDIEIPADDLLEAWADGERPEDLQMF